MRLLVSSSRIMDEQLDMIKLVIIVIKIINLCCMFECLIFQLEMDSLVIIPNKLASLEEVYNFCTHDNSVELSARQIREMFVLLSQQMIAVKNSQTITTKCQLRTTPEQSLPLINQIPKCQKRNQQKGSAQNDKTLQQIIKAKICQMEDIQSRISKIQGWLQNVQSQKLKQIDEERKYPKNYVNTQTSYFPLFEVQGRKIKYTGEDIPTMILGKHTMCEIGSFKIRIAECVLSNIKVGVCDSRYAGMRNCDKEDNMISMLGWKGEISTMLDYKCWEGIVFKQVGQVIEVKVDTKAGMITWLVDDSQQKTIEWPRLCDKTIKWVPMVRLLDRGTAIEWLEG